MKERETMIMVEKIERMLSENNLTFALVSDGAEDEEDRFVKVTEINLKPEYMKIQRKKVEGSQQRIEDGLVYFSVSSPMQIVNVRTFVQRLSDFMEEIALNKTEKGWSELYTKMLNQEMTDYDFVADLDSVYKSVEGSKVYGLVKNRGDSIKNIYVFFVIVELFGETVEVEEFCWPFLLRTKPVTTRSSLVKNY